MPKVHHFGHSGEAYNATQCDENIKGGDVLFIWPEGVVGIADTWPFAVTKEHGHLHAINCTPEEYAEQRDAEHRAYLSRRVPHTNELQEGVKLAREIIAETGIEDDTQGLMDIITTSGA